MKTPCYLFTKLMIALLFWGAPSLCLAQEVSSEPKEEGKNKLEITTSALYSYELEEKSFEPTFEIHPCFWVGHGWGVGFSYALKYDDCDQLHDLSLLASYEVVKWAVVNFGITMLLPDDDHRENLSTGMYAEVEWNYDISEKFHIGAVTGALLGDNKELTIGLQTGLKF